MEMSNKYKVALIRDAVYMNWRYVDNPDKYTILKFYKNGRICGIIVLKYTTRKGLPVGEVVDYLCPQQDTQTLKSMLSYAMKTFFEKGCVMVQSWAIKNTQLDSKLRSAGLRFRRKKVNFLLSPDAPYEDFYDKDAWLLTQGDGNDI